jgi:CelD/BcsL family acetyltransferase involved in cellulose biosynthesis
VSSLTCRVCTDPHVWHSLRGDWDRLLARTEGATPWQSLEFSLRWWRHLADARRLRLFVVERDARPVLIFPLQMTMRRWFGLPMQWLEPLGMLDQVNRPRLALGGDDPEAWACGLDAIWGRSPEWHALRIDEVTTDDPVSGRLAAFARERGLLYRAEPFDPCSFIDLRQSWHAYLQSRTAKFRKNLRAIRRRLETAGRVHLRVAESGHDFGAAFDTLLDIHTRSWKHWPRYGLSHSAELQDFYRDWLGHLARRGEARVLTLTLDDRPIAATLAVLDQHTYYSVEIAYDPEYSRFSPGTVLEAMELESLMRAGTARRYDPMTGAYGNKGRWAESFAPTSLITLLRPTPRMRLMDFAEETARPRVRRAIERVGLLKPWLAFKERLDALQSRYLD